MKYQFTIEEISPEPFTLETSIWTGKNKLFQNGLKLEQLKEKGRPFQMIDSTGQLCNLLVKSTLPDFSPKIILNGKEYLIERKLEWYEYVYAGLPFLLIFIGGAIGGGIGALASINNFNIVRNENSIPIRVFKVIGISLLSFLVYFLLAYFIRVLFN